MKKWLSGFLALTMLLTMCVFAPAVSAEAAANDPVVSRFVVVSDVHTNPTSPNNTINRLPKVFSTAYAYAEKQGGTVDAFVFNGDVIDGNQTSKGYTNEQEFEIFFQGVKDNIKSESKAVFAMARTHDIYDGDGNIYYVKESELNSIIAEKLGTDGSIIPTADWGYGPHLTKVNGVPVITLTNDIGNGNVVNTEDDGNTNNDDNADNSYHDSEAWLNTTLASLVAENPAQPIFVVFHYPEVGKLGWTQRWGQNSLRDTLNKYPQAIAVNAHVHWDPRLSDSITQDLFTEVYDGAVRDTGGPDATTVAGGSSPVVSYSMVEVTQSGAVTIKYIDPDTGNLLKEANGSGEVLEYSIPKAWDKSTYLYTDEAKYAVAKATFASNASIKLVGNTLTFDRAASEHPIIRYRVDVSNGTTTNTQYVFSQLYNETLPASYSCALSLTSGTNYTVTVTAIDGLYRDSANTLTLSGKAGSTLSGSATAVTQKTYAGNGTKGEYDYPDFKTYATTVDAENIANWGISDMEDLKAWSAFSKSNSCAGMTFHLENDIDMKDEIFNMIGSVYVHFKGTFDGHLHTISNLFIDDTSSMGTGFFVYTEGATIRNFGIENGTILGHISNRKYENAGTYNVSGTKRSTFQDVIGVGAIAGRADSTTFAHVWNGADITFRAGHCPAANGFANPCYAGLVGRSQNACTFVGCYNTGNVHGLDRASGITNWAQNGTYAARISNCFNLGKITNEAGNATEAIGRYNTVSTADNPYFCYNNYYLEGSATIPTNRKSTEYTVQGAEEPVALTAAEVKSDLAALLNADRFTGSIADTASWATDADGNVYIASVDESASAKVYTFSEYATNPGGTYFTINSLDEFKAFATQSKSDQFTGKTIMLNTDLDLGSIADFEMIGSDTYSFKGTFDGKGYTISNMKISSSGATRGLFREIETPGIVKNFTLKDATIAATQDSGMITAKITGGTVENVTVKGGAIDIVTSNDFGGIAGTTAGTVTSTIRNCTVDGVSLNGSTRQGLGGIIGNSSYITVDGCKVINCNIYGNRSNGLLGGFVYHGSTFQNCITYGNTFRSNFDTYGLIGRGGTKGGTDNLITVENCVFYETEMTTTTITDNVSNGVARTENFVLFRYSDTENIVTENVYTVSPDDSPIAAADVIHTTEAELASGKIAYELGWSMKDGKICLTDKEHAKTVKYTYIIDDGEGEIRYTDYAGNVLGTEVTLPENAAAWAVTEQANGDKIFSTASYDPNGIYPITQLETYPLATKFSVSTAAEFKAFADLVTAKKIGSNITVLQTANIDLSEYPNLQVGTERSEAAAFAGTYDGRNNTISGYSLSASSQLYAGMFKGLKGTIKNLVIDGASVSAKTHSAILVGETYGTANLIENVHIKNSTITVAERRAAFMLYGFNNGAFTVKNCSVSGCTMNTGTTAGNPIGLIATKADGSAGNVVENTYVFNNTINVQAATTTFGEILGDARSAYITNCGSFGNTFTGTKASFIGLVAATNKSSVTEINNCYTDLETLATIALENSANNHTGVTATAIADGSLAYKLKTTSEANWVQKDGYAQVASGSAVTKVTYVVDGETYATAYTDYTGAQIGGETALPEGAEKWHLVGEVNGDKTYKTVTAYDANGTYPIADFELYTNARKFTISSEADLNKLATLSKSSNLSGYTFTLTDNIDMSNTENFAMIGVGDNKDTCFAGTFDGAGYTISNLKINSTSQIAMFLPKNATIKNFTLKDADVRGGRYSGIVIGSAAATTVSDVHIVGAYFNPNDESRTYGGIAGYAYNASRAGAISTFTRCSVEDSEFDCAPNGGVGLIIGEMCAGTMTDCYAINNTLEALNRSGILIGYSYGVTIDGCFTYGNTMIAQEGKDITYPSGIAVGQVQTSATTVKNSIFCESDWDVYGYIASGSITFENCYTLCAAATAGTVATAEQLSSGELGYKTGIAMKDGKLILADADHAAPVKYTYVVEDATYATLYTDYEGKVIGTVADPEKENHTFDGWTESADGEAGDKLFTAAFTSNLNADVNGDNETNSADVAALLQYLNGNGTADAEAADVNGDGKVSLADALRLMKLLAE